MSPAPHATSPAPTNDPPCGPPAPHHDSRRGPGGCGRHGCGDLPELARLRYFHGQPLSALDLRREQAYHRDRSRLHNRLLHGWGVVSGLGVEVAGPRPITECEDDQPGAEVVVLPGAALDCRGDEILVRRPRPVRLDALLTDPERRRLKVPATVYLSICFHEIPIDPTRALQAWNCEPDSGCQHARLLDSYRLVLSLEPPDRGPDCEPECGACGDACVELAAIHNFVPGQPVAAVQVDTSVRRVLALRELTEIVGINWVHGATYTRQEANDLLEHGIEVWFSRGVEVASLRPGVVEMSVIEGGAGRAASTYHIDGGFDGLPKEGYTTFLRYEARTQETLQYGDRLTITVKGDFILDECCRALDADHVGGAVPFHGAAELLPAREPAPAPCPPRPSGDGVEGGEFLSWIFVEKRGDLQ